MSIVNFSFINNSTINHGNGGMIYNKGVSNFWIADSNFINNSAYSGGAIINKSYNVSV